VESPVTVEYEATLTVEHEVMKKRAYVVMRVDQANLENARMLLKALASRRRPDSPRA
jgi:hypothetical protein